MTSVNSNDLLWTSHLVHPHLLEEVHQRQLVKLSQVEDIQQIVYNYQNRWVCGLYRCIVTAKMWAQTWQPHSGDLITTRKLDAKHQKCADKIELIKMIKSETSKESAENHNFIWLWYKYNLISIPQINCKISVHFIYLLQSDCLWKHMFAGQYQANSKYFLASVGPVSGWHFFAD